MNTRAVNDLGELLRTLMTTRQTPAGLALGVVAKGWMPSQAAADVARLAEQAEAVAEFAAGAANGAADLWTAGYRAAQGDLKSLLVMLARPESVSYVLGESTLPEDLREQLIALLAEALRQGAPASALTGGAEATGELEAALSTAMARHMYPMPGLFPSAAEQVHQLRARVRELEGQLAAKLAGDEDPIAFQLTPAGVAVGADDVPIGFALTSAAESVTEAGKDTRRAGESTRLTGLLDRLNEGTGGGELHG